MLDRRIVLLSLAASERRVFIATADAVRAFDAQTGAPSWRQPIGAPRRQALLLDANNDIVALAYARDVVGGRATGSVFGADRGERRARFGIDEIEPIGELRITEVRAGRRTRTIVLLGSRPLSGYVDAIDADTGRRMWRGSGYVSTISRARGLGGIVVDGGQGITCDGGIVRAFDVIDGTTLWSWVVEDCLGLALARTVARPVLVVSSDGELYGFVLASPLEPPAWAMVQGTVRLDGRALNGVAVNVANERTRTDSAGRFRIRLAARGAIRVVVDPRSLPHTSPDARTFREEPRRIEIDGRRARYHLSIDLDSVPYVPM
jgi:hypothetical protein